MRVGIKILRSYRTKVLGLVGMLVLANHYIHLLVEDHATQYQLAGADTRVQEPLTFCQRRLQGGQATQSYDRLTEMNLSRKTMDGQVCQHPELDPCDPQVLPFDYFVHPVNCSKADENWVYVDNGTFRISRKALARYGDITCDYVSVERGETDFDIMEGELIEGIKDGSPITSDFFKVACKSGSNYRYHNIHVGVAYKESLHSRFRHADPGVKTMGYDVFMFGFDSMSRMAWLRNLPKSREFYIKDLKGMELTGYNIVGDATVNNLLPLLTGQSLKDLYSARWDDPYANHVDDFPFIWKSFRSAGYVTAWGEDKAYGGTFQMRLVGFNSTPTDHSMRPYYVAAESMYANFLPYCVGSEPRHIRFLNWFKDVFKMYGRKPKFVFGFHAEFSHDNNNQMKKIDDDLLTYLKYLNTSGILDHTILILMSDHGARIDQIRGTPQGKLEERLPYFSFRFPPSFKKSFPQEFLNFKNNRPRLVTPYDVYETFHHMLNVRGPPVDHSKNRGTSLFRQIPKTRTCADVEVKPHFCSCANLMEVKNESMLNRLSNEVVVYINNQTNKVRHLCSVLSLADVINIFHYTTHGGTSNQHGPDPASLFQFYQVTFRTSPNDGIYEATVKHLVPSDTLVVSEWQISRINRYGEAAACIEQTFPFLRQFCFCKTSRYT